MLSEVFQIQEFYCQISFHTRSIPKRAILQPGIRKRAFAYVHVSVCHTPSLTVSRASVWSTRFVMERKALSKNMSNQGKSKPMTHRPHRGSPWRHRRDLFDLSINTSHAHFLNCPFSWL